MSSPMRCTGAGIAAHTMRRTHQIQASCEIQAPCEMQAPRTMRTGGRGDQIQARNIACRLSRDISAGRHGEGHGAKGQRALGCETALRAARQRMGCHGTGRQAPVGSRGMLAMMAGLATQRRHAGGMALRSATHPGK
jgi:hypothetical protein